ncbi:hypothetical protein CYLTODRAFT_423451 [Cylindrobasidium torrendii FP15055 ss-10]|uniref:EF-hand domain-containing protein n=1 Tax=Cylindrobasidium torrendii FP15055 ss-10 TaxID=1314674 RepID=A0A0D7B794_9AGAR|nr:hypothetical protein CYLTODRAFT_423451 [Cylindrobasidium torrendii FP15055 ss-10]
MDIKEHDFAPRPTDLTPPIPAVDKGKQKLENGGNDSDTDTDTDTINSNGFDWNEKEEAEKNEKLQTKAVRVRAVYAAYMKLSRPVRTLLAAVLGGGICITPFLVVIFKFSDTSARAQVHTWSLWITATWVAGCITYLVVDLIPQLIIALVALFGGHIERLQVQIELAVAVSGWLKLVLDVSWSWIALGIIRTILKPEQSYWVTLNRVLQAFFGCSVLLLAEKLALHLVAIRFHQKALADRLAENQLALRALDRLSMSETKTWTKKLGLKGNGKTPATATGGPVEPKIASQGDIRKDRKRRRKAIAAVFVDQIRQIALKNSDFNRAGEMGSVHNARKLAKRVFSSLSDPTRDALLVEDFYPYFDTIEAAKDAFAIFDRDGNGDITKQEMKETVQRIYKERKALVASLKDASSAILKLDGVMLAVALFCMIFLFLLIFNRQNTVASLVPLGTIVLGFSFVFGNSAATLFESLIFIFATHVFDVGDLVFIDDQPLVVREFGLFATTFRRLDGQEIVAPNALLSKAKTIHNVRRSYSMGETTTLMMARPSCIKHHIPENSREWSGMDLNIDKIEKQNAIHVIVAMEHRPNWQDWGGRWARRTAFMKNLRIVLEQLDIRYTMPVQPVVLPHSPLPHGMPMQ